MDKAQALAKYLGVSLDDIENVWDDTYVVEPGYKKVGTSPTEALRLVETLMNAFVKVPGIDLVDYSRKDLERLGYKNIEKLLREYAADDLKIGLHDVLNTLYFLTEDHAKASKDHRDTLYEAYNCFQENDGSAKMPQDRRESVPCNGGEYLVLTDAEADKAWNESLENYLDECYPGSDSPYFNREAWKRDARMDGRGHSLSPYDGVEIELEGDLYAYRTN